MRITVNGKHIEVVENGTLSDFIALSKLESRPIIVELNECVVAKDLWARTVLEEGDRLELVSFVGGG